MIGNALELGQFELWCQPQVAARDGHVASVKAEVHWRHPERGVLHAAAISQALETTQLQHVFALHMACDALAALRMWSAQGFELDLALSLPLPAALLQDAALQREIAGLVAQAGMAPQRLTLAAGDAAGCCDVTDLLDWLHVREADCAQASGDFIATPQPVQVLPAALRRWQASYSVMSAADAFS